MAVFAAAEREMCKTEKVQGRFSLPNVKRNGTYDVMEGNEGLIGMLMLPITKTMSTSTNRQSKWEAHIYLCCVLVCRRIRGASCKRGWISKNNRAAEEFGNLSKVYCYRIIVTFILINRCKIISLEPKKTMIFTFYVYFCSDNTIMSACGG